jgi:hypothetical protein
MHTLVACPIGTSKLYSLAQWRQATAGYPRLLAVDTRDDCSEQLGDIPVVFYTGEDDPVGHLMRGKFNPAWRAIVAAAEGYTHILSLESDVIPPGDIDILAIMEAAFTDGVLHHAVPWGRSGSEYGYEMGCTLAAVETWRELLKLKGPLYGTSRSPTVPQYDINICELAHIH